MTLPLFFFYVFSIIAVASALMVIASRNPVHSVLFLILTFVNAAGLFMLAGAEFLALILIVAFGAKNCRIDRIVASTNSFRSSALAACARADIVILR